MPNTSIDCAYCGNTVTVMQKPNKPPVRYCSRECSYSRYGTKKGSESVTADELKRLYVDEGMAIGALARHLKIGHRSARALLQAHGIPQRSSSEEKRVTYAKMTPEQRSAMTSASHEAIAGKKRSHDDLCKRAKGKQRTARLSKDEAVILDAFHAAGLHPIPLFAVDKYNIDFAFPDAMVAVEYNGGNWHTSPPKVAADQVKAQLLQELGWSLLVFPRLAKSRIDELVATVAQALHKATPRPAR